MKIVIDIIGIVFIFSLVLKGGFCEQKNLKDSSSVTITVVYDNNEYDPRLETAWGFSCLVKGAEKTTLFDTGELGTWIKEESLLIDTERRLVIITGCAHPGIVKIVRRTKEILKTNVYLVMGGFHLGGMSERQIEEIVEGFKREGVKKVGPCHCSGNLARKFFKKAYGKDFIRVEVGKTIEIP